MNDRTLNDTELHRRLRTGFEALAREAGAPPVLPTSQRTLRQDVTGRRIAMAAVVLVALAAGGLAWSVRDGGQPDQRLATEPTKDSITKEAGDRPLVGTHWWLVQAEREGQPVDLDRRQDIGLHLTEKAPCDARGSAADCPWTGFTLSASDACSSITRPFDLSSPATIDLGSESLPADEPFCDGPLVQLLRTVYGAGSIGYQLSGEDLVVTRSDSVLTYTASDGPFAPATGTVLDDGEVGTESYQLVWEGSALTLQTADTTPGQSGRGSTSVGDDPGRVNPMRAEVGNRTYLFAVVPLESARVVYEPVGGAPQELQIRNVNSPTSAVVGALVDDAPDAWQLVAYDADGLELHRVRWGD